MGCSSILNLDSLSDCSNRKLQNQCQMFLIFHQAKKRFCAQQQFSVFVQPQKIGLPLSYRKVSSSLGAETEKKSTFL